MPDRRTPMWDLLLVGAVLLGLRAILLAAGVPYAGSAGVVASVMLIYSLQKRRGSDLGALGLRRPGRPGRFLLAMLAGIVGTLVVALAVLPRLQGVFPPPTSAPAPDAGLATRLVRVVAIAWVGAAFGEEVLFRGFLIDRLIRLLPGGAGVAPFVLVLQGAIFGAMHYPQGVAGTISAGLIGTVFAFVYWYVSPGRNLWPLIIAHAVPDTISLLGA